MDAASLKVLHILCVRCGPNGMTRCAMNYITHFQHTRADLACGFPLPESVKEDFAARGARAVSLPKRLRQPLRYYRALKKLIQEQRYDVVQIHGNSCTMALELLAAQRGGAAVRAPHGHNTQCSARLLHRLLRPAFEKHRTAAFACGQAAGEWLYRGEPFVVVKNAVDTNAFAFDAAQRLRMRGALGLDGCFVLGHVGGFNVQKNQSFLLEIFRTLHEKDPNAALVMAGDGPMRADVTRAVRDAGLEDCVRILPNCRDMRALYAAMDAFALPSLFEGLPFTLIEAQASGLSCFAADVVTREADMGGRVHYMAQGADAQDWAAAITDAKETDRAAASEQAADSIAKNGYSIAAETAALEALYVRLVEEARQ